MNEVKIHQLKECVAWMKAEYAAGGECSKDSSLKEIYNLIGQRFAFNAVLLQEVVDMLESIEYLRRDEGDSVELLCDNPEGEPNNAVEVRGEWTGNWEQKRFEGDTLLQALKAASVARHNYYLEKKKV